MAGGGPSNFRVQGKVYHSLGPLLPDSGQQPKFAQLYIYDTDSELQNRLNAFSGLRPALLSDLQTMLHQNNHWVQLFKTAAAAGGVQLVLRSNMGALRLLNLLWCNFTPHLFQCLLCCFCVYVLTFSAVCSAEGLDRRRYNVPTASEVAAILPGDGQEEDGAPTRRDIVVQLRGGGVRRICQLHPAYQALHFVLLFPHGELGWHPDIPLHGAAPALVQAG